MDSKPVWQSKINWVQFLMAITAVLCDPQLGNVVPVEYLPKIVWASNAATFFLRTFFSGASVSLPGSRSGRQPEGVEMPLDDVNGRKD
jgi:hypothetical protein